MITENTPIIMIDTETTNDIDCPIVYDVGYQIFTLDDGILCERSFVNSDVFFDDTLMQSAYFAEKIPMYLEEIKAGKRIVKNWASIKRQLAQDCKRFGVKIACAHNALFDNRALNTTQRYITSSKYRYFLPYGVEWWDTLKMARKVLKSDENYGEFCYSHDYLTQKGQRRYTAEIIYQWLKNDENFTESHTGLEDVKIEREIFEYLIKAEKEIDGRLWAN